MQISSVQQAFAMCLLYVRQGVKYLKDNLRKFIYKVFLITWFLFLILTALYGIWQNIPLKKNKISYFSLVIINLNTKTATHFYFCCVITDISKHTQVLMYPISVIQLQKWLTFYHSWFIYNPLGLHIPSCFCWTILKQIPDIYNFTCKHYSMHP